MICCPPSGRHVPLNSPRMLHVQELGLAYSACRIYAPPRTRLRPKVAPSIPPGHVEEKEPSQYDALRARRPGLVAGQTRDRPGDLDRCSLGGVPAPSAQQDRGDVGPHPPVRARRDVDQGDRVARVRSSASGLGARHDRGSPPDRRRGGDRDSGALRHRTRVVRTGGPVPANGPVDRRRRRARRDVGGAGAGSPLRGTPMEASRESRIPARTPSRAARRRRRRRDAHRVGDPPTPRPRQGTGRLPGRQSREGTAEDRRIERPGRRRGPAAGREGAAGRRGAHHDAGGRWEGDASGRRGGARTRASATGSSRASRRCSSARRSWRASGR